MDPSVIEGFFNLAAQAVSNRKPNVSVELPTIDDLRAGIEGVETPQMAEGEEATTEVPHAEKTQAESKGTACIPCSLSHVTACVGELNEAVRFAREDIANPEVTKRVNHCFSEIVACERIDLAPESTALLPPQEKEIADSVAKELRDIRHGLEWYRTKNDLENLAAKTAELQHDTYQKWLHLRLSSMPPELRQTVEKKLEERAAEQGDQEINAPA